MPALSILIKPVSGLCNLECSYCFYKDVTAHREVADYGRMKIETMFELIDRAFEYADASVSFAFQGGEPLLAGLAFYQTFVDRVRKMNKNQIPVQFAIQTNGMRINTEWVTFFSENRFLVGLSIDGTRTIHNMWRKTGLGQGSYTQAIDAFEQLTAQKVETNILCVVTEQLGREPESVYRHLREIGADFMQFIPCLNPLDATAGAYALSAETYGAFLCKIFDLWYFDITHGPWVSIRYFDNLLQILLGYPPESCDMAGRCSINAVVESDGSVYPCDFYVLDEWRMGSVAKDGFKSLAETEQAVRFIGRSIHKSEGCKRCLYEKLCRTGCTRHKEPFDGGMPSANRFCEAYRLFFGYALPRLASVARQIQAINASRQSMDSIYSGEERASDE
jgi:uncharacterized protein